ncbi:MAG TPA: hypothetical protein VJV78_07260 [Polyangiales bacterium]|nr:hypothetical protein [Polyangiales bacterium]
MVVPLRPEASWDACFAFSTRIAEAMAREQPEQYTTAFGKHARQDKILLDYKRNHRGAVAVAAYSSRARPAARLLGMPPIAALYRDLTLEVLVDWWQ